MRGTDETSGSLFSHVDLEDRIPARHPSRKIRQVVNDALASLDEYFNRLSVDFGRPSIAPERLIRASLIQILFSILSERPLIGQMQYNLLFRWFVGLGVDDAVWVPTVFSKNRDRLLTTEMSRQWSWRRSGPSRGCATPVGRSLPGRRHTDQGLGVDEELQAQGRGLSARRRRSRRSACTGRRHRRSDRQNQLRDYPNVPPQPSQPQSHVDFKGEKRSNATHASTTDPEARPYKKTPDAGAVLCFMRHALMENRHGLIIQGDLSPADGHAERKAAMDMLHRHSLGSTRKLILSADKAHDAAGFVADPRRSCVTPHVARKRSIRQSMDAPHGIKAMPCPSSVES